ncbi:GMP synthase-Glutamine amidotransferase [Verrucomicrobium sp. GAS474]|uniref:type 1 glutamine amidotransferase n=1 Tax=Verrucomicrobium sp. GAS474 TaxID=1882831 RepID=UPI00087BC6EE|nr:type 1 glutamine amidotransferase [Verrucomicrobium sp. GAS474]SDT98446.1 GMP synthase-Glutamine amidotransferase [Verrucomicrobium sp. GAS474]
MKFAALIHAPFETPAGIAAWIAARGHELELVHLHAGAALPPEGAYDALVVMGGPMNIYQYRDYPWLAGEARFLGKALAAGTPTLGICLGAQLLADVAGARVVQNREREIGWHSVAFTDGARKRFPSLPPALKVLHWHGDTFGLPPGALRLAVSEACGEQGFLIEEGGAKAMGLQFHLEIGPAEVGSLLDHCAGDLAVPGRYVQEADRLLAAGREHAPAAAAVLDGWLDAFFMSSMPSAPKA